jgi:hypothetical protein
MGGIAMNYEKAASYWKEKEKESVKMDSDALQLLLAFRRWFKVQSTEGQ